MWVSGGSNEDYRAGREKRESGGWRNIDEEIKQQLKNECRHALWTLRWERKKGGKCWMEEIHGKKSCSHSQSSVGMFCATYMLRRYSHKHIIVWFITYFFCHYCNFFGNVLSFKASLRLYLRLHCDLFTLKLHKYTFHWCMNCYVRTGVVQDINIEKSECSKKLYWEKSLLTS